MLSELIAARLERGATASLAEQVYGAIRELILAAGLAPGQKLPSSRQLAEDLALARNTIIDAYALLADEGYVEARTGAGSFVARTLPEARLQAQASARAGTRANQAGMSRRAQAVLDEVAIIDGGAFAPGAPDLSQFPFDVWQRLLSKAWRQVHLGDVRYAGRGGHPDLREAIAQHVQLTRQVRCTPKQVIVVNGAQHGLDLCARLLADAGDRVWVEDPGYPGARRAMRAADLELVPVRVDEEGMAPTAHQWKHPPRLLYITPSHQFPTGVVMSLRRRRELLEAASAHRCWIIEDDYDGEFRFEGRPIASMQGIDDGQRVIYLGTFSKAMFPGLRLGYLVLPESIASRFSLAASQLAFEGRLITQSALAQFMREGHFTAHVRRMRMAYARRRSLFEEIWRSELGDRAPLSGLDTGMHMIASLPMGADQAVSDAAAREGIIAQSLGSLFIGKPDRSGLVLGYGAVDENGIRRNARKLARLVAQALTA